MNGGFEMTMEKNIVECQRARLQDTDDRMKGGMTLESVRARADGVRRRYEATADTVRNHAGTKRHTGYAALASIVADRFRFLVDWLVESVEHEAAELGSLGERVAFLHDQLYDLRSSGYGESDVGQRVVDRIGALLEGAERRLEREAASARGSARAVPPIPWRSSQTRLAIMLDMLHKEGLDRGISLPEDASIREDLKFVDFLKRLLPAFVNAKTGESFSLDGVQRHATDHPAYRVELEEEVKRRRGEAPM